MIYAQTTARCVASRPLDQKAAERNVGLPPYRPIMDVDPRLLINYNQVRGLCCLLVEPRLFPPFFALMASSPFLDH